MCMSVFTVVKVVFTGKTTLHLKTTATKEKVQFTYVIVVIVVQILSIMYHIIIMTTTIQMTTRRLNERQHAKLAESEE